MCVLFVVLSVCSLIVVAVVRAVETVSASVIPPSHDHTSDDSVRVSAIPRDGEHSLVASSASAASVDRVVASDARDKEDKVHTPLSSSSPRGGTKRPREEAASARESLREEEEEEVSGSQWRSPSSSVAVTVPVVPGRDTRRVRASSPPLTPLTSEAPPPPKRARSDVVRTGSQRQSESESARESGARGPDPKPSTSTSRSGGSRRPVPFRIKRVDGRRG